MPAASHRFAAEKGSTAARGYGSEHRKARQEAAAAHDPAHPCVRCGEQLGPMGPHLHLDHNGDRTGYLGFAHASCNREAGAREGRRRQGDDRCADQGWPRLAQPTVRACAECGTEFMTDNPRHVSCSAECSRARARTSGRNRYRTAAGIPIDSPLDPRGRPRRDWYASGGPPGGG